MKKYKKIIIIGIILAFILLAGSYVFFIRKSHSDSITMTPTNCFLSKDAPKEIGKDTCVEFYVENVVQVKNGNMYLDEKTDYKKGFFVTIFANNVHNFTVSPIDYKYKIIDVSGVITKYQGMPEIIVTDPSQIATVKE